jgi:hypothetical protein
MPATYTPKLGLKKPAGVDPFLRTDFEENWDALDLAPGTHICTSASRPAWAAGRAGRLIFETDTGSLYRWTGTTWRQVKQSPNGWSYYNNWANEVVPDNASVNKTITQASPNALNSSTPGTAFYICSSSVQYVRGSVQELYKGFEYDGPGGGGYVAAHNGERALVRWAIPTGSIPGSPDNDVRTITVTGTFPIEVGETSLRATFEAGNGANGVTIRHTRTLVWMVNTTNQ